MAKVKKRRIRSKTSGVDLPTESKGIGAATSHTLFIYGPEGIGKSTFGSHAPSPLFIATEAGLNFLDVMTEPCPDWDKFVGIVDALEASKSQRYKTVVIDTADNAIDQCQSYACDKLGIEHPADEEWGKGYSAVRMEFNKQITRLALLDMRFILISHQKSVEIKGRVMKTTKIVPTLSNSGRRVILPMCDFIGHCTFKEGRDGEATSERIINFEPSEYHEAKDRSGLLPKIIPLDYEVFNGYMDGSTVKRSKSKTTAKRKVRRKVRR